MSELYLSRLILNLRSRDVRRDLSDCQNLHRTILKAFPQQGGNGQGARAEFGVLFRTDVDRRSGLVTLLVQSQAAPDWAHLPPGYLADAGGADGANPACKPVGEVYESLQSGARLVFRLRANPTRKIETKSLADGTKQNGRRVELRTEGEQMAWLRRKAEGAGFRLLAVRLRGDVPRVRAAPEGKAMGWRGEGVEKRQRLTFASVLFEGELEIADAEKFRAAIAAGIGTGKAYGFGLLSLARAAG
jgi:CRISPR system Cascade subunit CasE